MRLETPAGKGTSAGLCERSPRGDRNGGKRALRLLRVHDRRLASLGSTPSSSVAAETSLSAIWGLWRVRAVRVPRRGPDRGTLRRAVPPRGGCPVRPWV